MDQTMNELTWSLADPGMDLLERAGLAGLFMTLRAARDAGHDLSPLTFSESDLAEDSVTVQWTGPANVAFTKLMEWAWQVRDGVLYFPAVHEGLAQSNWFLRVSMHNGVMRTFLQHPNAQPKMEAVTRDVTIDDEKQLRFSFEPPAERVEDSERGINPKTKRLHLKKIPTSRVRPHEDLEKLFDSRGAFKKREVTLSNWVYPGIAGRYGEEKSWEGTPERTLLIMLAPTVCIYERLQGEGNNWVIVVPDVRDLTEFDTRRRDLHLNPDFVDVASLGDAGIRFLSEYAPRDLIKDLRSGCRVIAMGYVGYYQGQSIRKSVVDVSPRIEPVKRYRVLHSAFPNDFVRHKQTEPSTDKPTTKRAPRKTLVTKPPPPGAEKQASGFYVLPTGRGRIADNLVAGRPWYTNLFVPLVWDNDELERLRKKNRGMSTERLWFTSLSNQWSKLMRLINQPEMWDSEAEKVFVEAVWETLSSLYAKEAAAVSRGGSATAEKRFERLEGEIYRKLTQAKTRPLVRGVMAEMLAKAGRQHSIGKHPQSIWHLLDDRKDWQKGRDLALLALASHRRKPGDEATAGTVSDSSTEETKGA